MLGSLRIRHFGFLISVIVAVLIIGISRDATAQPPEVECPCRFFESVPLTTGCWSDTFPGGVTYSDMWFNDPSPTSGCATSNGGVSSGDNIAIAILADELGQSNGRCFITFVNKPPDCDSGFVFLDNLLPEEVRACQCELSAYTAALNEVAGITVSPAPYVCGDVDCTPPQFINLSPSTATNDVGTDHTVTATVDIDGVPDPDVLVNFEVISGPNAGLMSVPNNGECSVNNDCTTDGNGQVSWTYTGSITAGTDTIVASFFSESAQMVIESNTVEKIWVIPPRNIPTLSEWGLIVMAGILGIIGFIMVMRRRKAAA